VEILDYKDRASGAKLPEWVSLYINHGVSALEKLEGFAPYFVFVAEQSSPNLDTLLQWSGNFSHERNMTHLVLLRAYRRLTENISVNPDDMYGVFFETFIKRLASRYWPSSQKYDGVWVLVQRLPVAAPQDASASEASYQDDIEQDLPEDTEEETSGSRLYLYLILNLIEKPELQNAVQFVMNDITLDEALERDQVQAVNSIKANFFNGF
jgi:hypothetical protein